MIEHAELTCSACGRPAPHELSYAGRLLQSTTCRSCGHVVRHEQRDLYRAYLHDLEQRMVSKPRRMLNRAQREPVEFFTTLPSKILRQPRKFLEEWQTVSRRNRRR